MSEQTEVSEELRLLRHRLGQADRRLAESEAEVVELRARNVALTSQTANAQRQLRDMRTSGAWRVAVSLLTVGDSLRRGLSQVSTGLRGIKRKTIG